MLVVLAVGPALWIGCGSEEATESGGLASTSSTTTDLEQPLPEGLLDDLLAERIGDLELVAEQGAGEVRRSGAIDARAVDYQPESGEAAGTTVTVALWPSPGRARAYARKTAQVLESEQGFESRGSPEPFAGPQGEGTLYRLANSGGIEAAIWTAGRVGVYALAAGAGPLETLLAQAPYGRGGE